MTANFFTAYSPLLPGLPNSLKQLLRGIDADARLALLSTIISQHLSLLEQRFAVRGLEFIAWSRKRHSQLGAVLNRRLMWVRFPNTPPGAACESDSSVTLAV